MLMLYINILHIYVVII